MTVELRFVCTTARGRVLGESNGQCRYSNTVVEQARQMRASGMYYHAISAATGAALSTVYRWVNNGARPEPARVIVKRLKRVKAAP
jgi:hypothetical protein